MSTYDGINLLIVGTAHNVGVYIPQFNLVSEIGNLGGWTIRQLAVDSSGNTWCVGSLGNLGQWSTTSNTFTNYGNYGNLTINSISFDENGAMWAVDNGSNLYQFSGSTPTKIGTGLLSIAFDNSNNLWAISSSGQIGLWQNGEFVANEAMCSGNTFVTVAIDDDQSVWAVTAQCQVMQWMPAANSWTPYSLANWEIFSLSWGGIPNPDMIQTENLHNQCVVFGNLMFGSQAIQTAFMDAPVDTMINNGVTLGFLSDTQLNMLNALLLQSPIMEKYRSSYARNQQIDFDNPCDMCYLTIVTILVATYALYVYLTGGLGALLAQEPLVQLLAVAFNVNLVVMQGIFTGAAAAMTILDIPGFAEYICLKLNYCENSTRRLTQREGLVSV